MHGILYIEGKTNGQIKGDVNMKKLQTKLTEMKTEELIQVWEDIKEMDTDEAGTLRMNIAATLSNINEEAFEKWMDDEFEKEEEISPREYFIK